MSVGGWLADRLSRKDPRALFLVPGVAMLAALPFLGVALFSTSPAWIFGGILLAEALMFVNTGPCNAIIGNVITPNMRSAAYAIGILVFHFLGDIWSPWLIGLVADYTGQPDVMATWVGDLLRPLGAVPTIPEGQDHPQNLLAGLLIVLPAIALSGVVMLAGARHLPREMALMLARLRATKPRGSSPKEGAAAP